MSDGELLESVKAAFNIGVLKRQDEPDATVEQASEFVRVEIVESIERGVDRETDPELYDFNVEYLTQVGLLGFLMSGIMVHDEEVMEKIPHLIVRKIVEEIEN